MACKYIYKSKEYTLDEIKNDLENILSENKLSKDELLFKKVNPVLAFQLEAQQVETIPSVLFEQLRQQPFITSEQALEAYKNIYTDSVGDWQSSEMNC